MFTQQHFVAIAATIKSRREIHEGDSDGFAAHKALVGLTEDLVDLFKDDNERFNEARFVKACGLKKDKPTQTLHGLSYCTS